MRRSSLWVFAALILLVPDPASAVPIFANGQGGVQCSLCHSSVPQLNSYGRYVLMTNFSRGLNRHLQMMQNRSLPIALEAAANVSHPASTGLPALSASIVQWLSAGFLGRDVSYFATVPMVSGGFPAASVDQLWVADNAFDRGNGSLQVGRFATPIFAPWISQPLSLSGYALADLQVGSNATTLADNRWGASYSQVADNGLVANLAYLHGNGSAWSGSLQFLSPETPWSGGIAALSGTSPPQSGRAIATRAEPRSYRTTPAGFSFCRWPRSGTTRHRCRFRTHGARAARNRSKVSMPHALGSVSIRVTNGPTTVSAIRRRITSSMPP